MKLISFFFIPAILTFVLTFCIFSIVRTRFFSHRKKNSSAKREFLISLFAGYISIVCLLLFTPNTVLSRNGVVLDLENYRFITDFKDRIAQGLWGMNLVPFDTIKKFLKYGTNYHIFTNIIGNILIFIPMGFFLPKIYTNLNKFHKVFIITLLISIFVEGIQFFVGRTVDIDDIILYEIGVLIGYIINLIFKKI